MVFCQVFLDDSGSRPDSLSPIAMWGREVEKAGDKLNDWILRGLEDEEKEIIKTFLKNSTYEYLLTPNPIAREFVQHLIHDHLRLTPESNESLVMVDMMGGTGMEAAAMYVMAGNNVTIALSDMNPLAVQFLKSRFQKMAELHHDKWESQKVVEIFETIPGSILDHTGSGPEHTGPNILNLFSYGNIEAKESVFQNRCKQAHIVMLDPMWPGGQDYEKPEHARSQYFIESVDGQNVLVTDFVEHLFQHIPALKVVPVKVANFLMRSGIALQNNRLVPDPWKGEATHGHIQGNQHIEWHNFRPKTGGYSLGRGHIRYCMFVRRHI